MITEAAKAAKARYDAKTAKYISLKLNRNTDMDIISKLEQQESIQAYIKSLIRNDMEGGSTMTKFDVIETLTDNGFFELTQEILDIIKADTNPEHEAANKSLYGLIDRVNQMESWTQFSWRVMLDLVCQAYGFEKYLGWSGINACADVEFQMEDLHTILWNNFRDIKPWNGWETVKVLGETD